MAFVSSSIDAACSSCQVVFLSVSNLVLSCFQYNSSRVDPKQDFFGIKVVLFHLFITSLAMLKLSVVSARTSAGIRCTTVQSESPPLKGNFLCHFPVGTILRLVCVFPRSIHVNTQGLIFTLI